MASPSSSEASLQEQDDEPQQNGGHGVGIRKSVEFSDQVEKRHIIEDHDQSDEDDSDSDQDDLNTRHNDNTTKDFLSEDESESEVDIGVKQDLEDTSSEASSSILDQRGRGYSHARIARGFRPEVSDDLDTNYVDSRISKRSVSFTPKSLKDMGKTKSPAITETSKRKTYDGREVTMVTLDTQTDWDWAQDAMETGKHILPHEGDGVDKNKDKADLKSILVKPDSREQTSQSKTDTSEPSVDDRIAPTTPFTPYSDEFGIPILDISTDSDDYVRESEQTDISVEDPNSRKNKDDVMDTKDFPVDEFGRPLGMFGGKCEFCTKDIRPFPSVDRQKNLPANEIFCCEEYRDFVNFATTTAMELEEEAKNAQKLINIKPHAHFGTKQDRKMAKERAVQRMRERELQRRQQEASGLQQSFYSSGSGGAQSSSGGGGGGGGGGPAPRAPPMASMKANIMPAPGAGLTYKDVVARQMKTINYQLSSQRCLEEGWTLRPPSPLDNEDEDLEIFIPEPLGGPHRRSLIQKFYEDGSKFLTIFPDGSGNVFYPSGQVAILVTCVSAGQYIYVVHDDSPNHTVQAVFEPNGHGSCFHNNGIVRLFFDQLGGIELDVHGARRRKWQWKDPETHVHAPPFQPICFGLNRHIGIRVMSQESVALTLTAKKRSCRFNVGSKLKLVAPGNIPPREIDDAVLFLDECKAHVETILDRVTNLLKFPKSPKLDKILPPIHLTSKIQRTEKLKREKAASRLATSGGKTARKGVLPVVTVN